MKFERHDYLIVKDEKDRKHLIQVTGNSKAEVTGALEKSRHIEGKETEYMTVAVEDVIINLGNKPYVGMVYGCRVNPLQNQLSCNLGDIYIYRDNVKKKEKKALVKAINSAQAVLKNLGLHHFQEELRFEVHPQKGKYVGWYTVFSAKSERFDMVTLKPHTFDHRELMSILYHEFGHGLEHHLFTPELTEAWIKLYHSFTTVTMATKKQVEEARKTVIEQGSHGLAQQVMEEFESSLIDVCVGYIAENHYIDPNRLEILIEQGHDLVGLWPETPMPVTSIQSPIGEYSETNPSEFFCEALRIHLDGSVKLPKKINKLLTKTLNQLRGRKPQVEEDEE
ncbi:hypothetical protein GR7B_00172 [Vibrio phage vB_VcorM_GR7B]|nr:hypothetical protein GR7B_00172 [Vibrio phage vB_VcorM_GR7B]